MFLTLENQFEFQNPGVPHGQAASPPESMHEGTVKSFSNQKPIAEEMAERKDALFAYWAAFLRPPCQAAEKVTETSFSKYG